jgi:hypothetical protein
MSANSSASPRIAGLLLAVAVSASAFAEPGRWYASDAAGIAYEDLPSRAALRSRWALEIRILGPGERERVFPGPLSDAEQVELKTLYEDGAERRKTVSVLDASGFARFEESASADGFLRRERYDPFRRLIEETTRAADGSGTTIEYEWSGDRILRAVAHDLGDPEGTPLWIDTYRYDRAGALRSVERAAEAAAFYQDSRLGSPRTLEFREPDGSVVRTRFDGKGRESETIRIGPDGSTVVSSEKIAYEAGAGGKAAASTRRSTDEAGRPKEVFLDGSGRVVRETILGADGEVAEETRTEWKDGRVTALTVLRGKRVLRTEYGYDARGNRMLEQNFSDGVLERTVRKEGNTEIEELYRNGVLSLRARYENGILVSEEPVRPSTGGRR